MKLIDADGSYTLNASDNTDYSLCFGGGIISAIDKHGHVVCEFFADDAPTVDAEQIRHVHWKRYDMDIAEHPHHCSCCGWSNYRINRYVEEFKFCPNCGAKMWMV